MLLYGVIVSPMKKYNYPLLTPAIAWLSVQSLFITLLLTLNQTLPFTSYTILHHVLILDDFTTIIKAIVLLSALSSILISLDYLKNLKINSFEYIILLCIATFSMLLVISSYDLISLYLAIELQSLSFYVITAFQRNNEFSIEAGLKYFILGALSSGFLLFGESLIYGFTGITNFEELAKYFTLNSLVIQETSLFGTSAAISLGLLFILVAFLFKIGAVPFHMWTPDVYHGAPTSVTAFFSITPKIAIFALLLRLCLFTFYDSIETWQVLIISCSLLSMYIGTLGAIQQNKIKRLFAYSSIAHVGYMLIGLATGTIESLDSLLLYIIVYIIMILNIFGVLLIMSKESWSISPPVSSYIFKSQPIALNNISLFSQTSNPLWNKYEPNGHSLKIDSLTQLKDKGSDTYIKYITDLCSLAKTNPLLAATLALVFFSNAGVPPLAGFYGKFSIILSAVEGSMYFLALAAIICSVIGAFYSIRLIKIMYYHNISRTWLKWSHYKPISKVNSFILAITLFFTMFFFLYPSFLWTLTHSAALSLCL